MDFDSKPKNSIKFNSIFELDATLFSGYSSDAILLQLQLCNWQFWLQGSLTSFNYVLMLPNQFHHFFPFEQLWKQFFSSLCFSPKLYYVQPISTALVVKLDIQQLVYTTRSSRFGDPSIVKINLVNFHDDYILFLQ